MLVSKPNIFKLDSTPRSFGFDWLRRIQNCDWQVKSSEDAMRRDNGGLKHVVLVRNITNGLEQKSRVLNESNQSTQRQHHMLRRVLHHAITAVPNNQSNAYCADEVNQRKEDSIIKYRI